MFKHQISLQKPDLEEYEQARAFWQFDHEESTEEQLKTASCDYDSETGKRYSEDESEEESNTDHELRKSSSENNSSSDSASEGSTISYQKKKRRTKKALKETPAMVPLDHYEKDKKDLSSQLEEHTQAMEAIVHEMRSTNTNLINENKSKVKEISELKEELWKMLNKNN